MKILFLSTYVFLSCSQNGNHRDENPAPAQAFGLINQAAVSQSIPSRLILAVGYLESRFNLEPASAFYEIPSLESPGRFSTAERPLILGQTVFGIPLSKLRSDGDKKSITFESQIKAYAQYLNEQLKAAKLDPNATTVEQKIRWIWEISRLHRTGIDGSKDLRAIFARELLQILNTGFEVPLPSGELLKLEKENPPITEDKYPLDMQRTLRISSTRGEIRSAFLLSLGSLQKEKVENKPKGIIVIHCPFSMSACLDMQNNKIDDNIKLAAHYVIPPNDDLIPGIVQTALHKEAVPFLDETGAVKYATNSVVVMLTGYSGAITHGERNPASPDWLNENQLRLLGGAVQSICEALADSGAVDLAQCKAISKDRIIDANPLTTHGVYFKKQQKDFATWGDIADFDSVLFNPYIADRSQPFGDTKINLSKADRKYTAGQSIDFSINFQPRGRRIEIERMVRCAGRGGKVVWDPIVNRDVRNETKTDFNLKMYDSGPNENGQQFIRVKVLGEDGSFLGWSVEGFSLQGYEIGKNTVRSRSCE